MSTAPLAPVAPRAAVPARLRAAEEYVTWSLVSGLVRRRWPLILLALVLSVGAAVAYLLVTPPTYEAAASLLIESEQYNVPETVRRTSTESDVNTQLEVLRSARLADTVARELVLRVGVTAYRAAPLGWLGLGSSLPAVVPATAPRSRLVSALAVADSADTGTVTLLRVGPNRFVAQDEASGKYSDSIGVGSEAAVGPLRFTLAPEAADYARIRFDIGTEAGAVFTLQQQLKIARADRDVDVLWIRYRSGDPVLAGQVPDLLAAKYLALRVESARSKIQTAVRFLQGQSDTLQRQLLGAEQELRDYRQRQGIVDLPTQASSKVTQSAELGTRRMMLESEYAALHRLVAEADTTGRAGSAPSPYRRLAGFPTLINNPVVSGRLQALSELEDQRAQLLERRTAQDPDVQMLTRRIGDVDMQLRGLTNAYLQGLQNQVSSLDGQLRASDASAARIPAQSMGEDRLSRKPKLLGDVYGMVQTRLQEARIAESAIDPGVRQIDQAGIPRWPVWPRASLILAVALLVGLLGGTAGAWLREGMDDSVHSRADVIRATGVPLLGLIPRIRMLRTRKQRDSAPVLLGAAPAGFGARAAHRRVEPSHRALLLGGKDRSGSALEAYAWLETSLALTRPADAPRTVAFTSALSREGKTINAANLALSVARRGRRVLLIDADLRRGMIHHLFGISRERGLADVLSDRLPVAQAIRCLPLGEGGELHVMPCGETPVHPAGILRSGQMATLVAALAPRYDLVLIDSPPVNLVSDALVLAGMVDGVILVARAGVTEAGALAEASQHLRTAGAPLLGVVLNDIDLRRDGSYDDAYRYLDQAGAYAVAAGEAVSA